MNSTAPWRFGNLVSSQKLWCNHWTCGFHGWTIETFDIWLEPGDLSVSWQSVGFSWTTQWSLSKASKLASKAQGTRSAQGLTQRSDPHRVRGRHWGELETPEAGEFGLGGTGMAWGWWLMYQGMLKQNWQGVGKLKWFWMSFVLQSFHVLLIAKLGCGCSVQGAVFQTAIYRTANRIDRQRCSAGWVPELWGDMGFRSSISTHINT